MCWVEKAMARLLARHGKLIDSTMDLMATGCKIINCIKL